MSLRALVVDGSTATRALLARILREAGFEILEAGHGRQALEILRRHHATTPIDVLLVDWNLEEMDGFELLCFVRADEAFRSMRVVMVTSETDVSRVCAALDAGADEYAMKPFTRDVILEKLAILELAVP
jgi:two-component system chemotaxis response regulator CheY